MKIITVVTAASSNHFKSVCQFLRSVPDSFNVIFYDIGLTSSEEYHLKSSFPNVTYRFFDFSKYPEYVKLSSPDAGAYTWKPIIIHEVYSELSGGVLLWCDAGTILYNTIHQCIDIVKTVRIFSARTSGTIRQYTHSTAIHTLGIPSHMFDLSMRNASFVGILCNDDFTRQFVSEWLAYALNKEVILPTGANRMNHRHDQSILTYLYYKHNIRVIDQHVGYSIQNDID